jgi:hypothetical protein
MGVFAQCPPGNVVLTTQAQINQFAVDYPNCTIINGYLQIGAGNNTTPGSDITDLTPLGNITTVNNNLYIQNNAVLQNVDGLHIESVGGFLFIGGDFAGKTNLVLTNLDGLSSLTSVAQDIYIRDNHLLNDISALENATFQPFDGYGLSILLNPNLAVCNLSNFCAYLANPSSTHPRSISGNLAECVNEQAVIAACGLGISDVETYTLSYFPNPVKDVLNLSYDVKMNRILITNMLGQVYMDKGVDSNNLQVDMTSFSAGNYLVKVISEDKIEIIRVIKQ